MPDIAAQPYVKTFSRKQRKQEQKDERGFPKNKRAVAVPVTKANDGQRQRARGDQRACDLPPKRDAAARIGKQQERVEKRNARRDRESRPVAEKQTFIRAKIDADGKPRRDGKEDGDTR